MPPGVLREGRDGRRLIGGGLLLRRTPATSIPLFVGVRLRALASGRSVGPGEGTSAGTVEAGARPIVAVKETKR